MRRERICYRGEGTGGDGARGARGYVGRCCISGGEGCGLLVVGVVGMIRRGEGDEGVCWREVDRHATDKDLVRVCGHVKLQALLSVE